MTVASTSHLRQTARNRSTLPGSTIAHIRSCDSLIRISAGVSVVSRSGTASRSMCIPPVPALASSLVAQDSPAPPRSWIPVTRSCAKISRQKGFFIYDENKNIIAELEYKKVDNILILDHTEVSDVLKGQGIAAKLLDEAVSYARN